MFVFRTARLCLCVFGLILKIKSGTASPFSFRYIGPKELMQVSLTGIEDAVNKHNGPNVEPKGIKAHFALDESGVLSLTSVDYVVEKIGGAEPSTLEKIGSSFSKMFGSGKKSGDETKETEQPPEAETSAEADEKRNADVNLDGKEGGKNETEETTPIDEKIPAENVTEKVKKTEKPKPVIIKEEIKNLINVLGVKGMSSAQQEVSQKK